MNNQSYEALIYEMVVDLSNNKKAEVSNVIFVLSYY